MVIFSKPREALKKKLVIMALETANSEHHCRNPDNWILVQVIEPFVHDGCSFQFNDITVLCAYDAELEALCTRILRVVTIPAAFKSRFKVLEDIPRS